MRSCNASSNTSELRPSSPNGACKTNKHILGRQENILQFRLHSGVRGLRCMQYESDKKDIRGEMVTKGAMLVQYVGNLWFNFPPRLEMEPHPTQKANAIVIPVETWLRICMHRRMDDFPALAHAAHTWTEEGGRVFVLVKRLRVGKQGHINGPDDVHNDTANDAHTCRSFIDNVSKMHNLTELVLRNVVIPSSIVSLASKLQNLRELSLEGVCIADVGICREDVEVEHCMVDSTHSTGQRAAETDYMVTIVQGDEVAAHSRLDTSIPQRRCNAGPVVQYNSIVGSANAFLEIE
ncbi:hypothetical protein C8R41DRAFT_865648 [Lentinula lateritia]|uniref:Uncharacterized protein n=1 Tax=Lentinula lateritia TaxID=40482 RepID=A0ABQ8VLT6_9AGAR|nr:hypothetical protein C8R41DRAFT_865647 [Lentinula lateritia]KAJ4497338.1 hypothetical protein C8R41DRAFT_865648 [Lentinula lateritia]